MIENKRFEASNAETRLFGNNYVNTTAGALAGRQNINSHSFGCIR